MTLTTTKDDKINLNISDSSKRSSGFWIAALIVLFVVSIGSGVTGYKFANHRTAEHNAMVQDAISTSRQETEDRILELEKYEYLAAKDDGSGMVTINESDDLIFKAESKVRQFWNDKFNDRPVKEVPVYIPDTSKSLTWAQCQAANVVSTESYRRGAAKFNEIAETIGVEVKAP